MKDSCNVLNKSSGRVVYNIKDPDCFVRREFFPGQLMKNVPVKELERLVQQPGGLTLFYNYLQISDEEILSYLLNGIEPAIEYWLSEDQIPSWINTCSEEEFRDACVYAPEGTKDLLKKYAVSVPLKNMDKRQAMLETMGFDVTAAINLADKESEVQDKKVVTAPTTGRKATSTSIIKPSAKTEKKN